MAPTIQLIDPNTDKVITVADSIIESGYSKTITWRVTDSESGINISSIYLTVNDITINQSNGIAISEIENGYECNYTINIPSRGVYNIVYFASDNNGNEATNTVKISITKPFTA